MELDQTVFCIVDRAAETREILTLLAASIGVKAEVHGSVDEYLDRFDNARQGCLVIELPATGGEELLESLAIHGVCLPIILIIGSAGMVSGSLKAVAFQVFQKPFVPRALVDCLHRALKRNAEVRVRV
jgi:FixJ family two-component response regulator